MTGEVELQRSKRAELQLQARDSRRAWKAVVAGQWAYLRDDALVSLAQGFQRVKHVCLAPSIGQLKDDREALFRGSAGQLPALRHRHFIRPLIRLLQQHPSAFRVVHRKLLVNQSRE